VALLSSDYIMQVPTSSMVESIDKFILNGLLGGEAWLEEDGHWWYAFEENILSLVCSYLSICFLPL
jgi:hypothetical protein